MKVPQTMRRASDNANRLEFTSRHGHSLLAHLRTHLKAVFCAKPGMPANPRQGSMNESQRIQAELNVERGFSAGHTIRIEHACARMQPKSGTEGCTVFGSHPPVTVEEAQRLASRSAGMSRRESRLHRSHVPDLKSTVKSRQNHFNPSKLFNIIVVMLNIANLGRKRRFSAVLSIQALRLPLSATQAAQTSDPIVAAPRTARSHCCSTAGFVLD